jgi:hypothetical protein
MIILTKIDLICFSGDAFTDEWYQEYKNYDFKKPKYDHLSTELTQMIWKNTEQVGFGIAKFQDGGYYMVAYYYPAGNMDGHFSDNVFDVQREFPPISSVNTYKVDNKPKTSSPSLDENYENKAFTHVNTDAIRDTTSTSLLSATTATVFNLMSPKTNTANFDNGLLNLKLIEDKVDALFDRINRIKENKFDAIKSMSSKPFGQLKQSSKIENIDQLNMELDLLLEKINSESVF